MNKYIAIIGKSGSGKSSALKIIENFGCCTKDYDQFSTKTIINDCLVHKKIKEITNINHTHYDYYALKEIGCYFDNHPDKEYSFEKWFQPYLGKIIKNDMKKMKNPNPFYIDIPFIEEKNLLDYMDSIWIIQASTKICFNRIKKRNNYSSYKINYLLKRSKLSARCFSYADLIIDNNCNNIQRLKQKIYHLITLNHDSRFL